jgi:chromate transporter
MPTGTTLEVLVAGLRLGLTSFGGPIAHVGYQHAEYVVRRRWVDDATFGELVGLTQTLPGPASSQLGIAIGMLRAGYPGALAAWIGFTLPSAVLMTLIGVGVASTDLPASGPVAGLVSGLKVAAVAVVAHALVAMARRLTPDVLRLAMAVLAGLAVLLLPTPATQLGLIAAGALAGVMLLSRVDGGLGEGAGLRPPVSRRAAGLMIAGLIVLLLGLPLLAAVSGDPAVALTDAVVRAGALVFGGGHVVLPLLEAGVVTPGFVDPDVFVTGYGATQAMPGPLFTFASYLGAVSSAGPGGVVGAAIATVAIFVPGGLLVLASLAAWNALRTRPRARRALAGVNAVVVGLLGAALVSPVATSALVGPLEALVAAAGGLALVTGRVPPLVVVAGCAMVMAGAGLVAPGVG